MNIAICYHSQHHGNTKKVAEAMAKAVKARLIPIDDTPQPHLEEYDIVGFASGIYAFQFGAEAVEYLRKHMPQGKPVFFVYTYGVAQGTGSRDIAAAAKEKDCPILGEFSCRGYVTYGPFKLIGGASKGRPNGQDLDNAVRFIRSITGQA